MSPDTRTILPTAIGRLATQVPADALDRLAAALETLSDREPEAVRPTAFDALPQLQLRPHLEAVLRAWEFRSDAVTVGQLTAMLRASAATLRSSADNGKMELVWTGPEAPAIPLRRTDQALLEVIDAAQKRLVIVSFAVQAVSGVVQAINRATARGVQTLLCLETSEASEGRFRGSQEALVQSLPGVAFYHWPADRRQRSPKGQVGVLHAKFAVADGRLLFLSSANLTDYAQSINLELGVLIRGGDAPVRVEHQIEALMTDGTFTRIP